MLPDLVYPLLCGLRTTVALTVTSSILGLCVTGILLAGLSYRWKPVRVLARAYVFFFRGTPLLAQMYLIYYGSGQFRDFLDSIHLWPLLRQAWFCALLSLTLNTAAYMAAVAHEAYHKFPAGEIEAAYACGLNPKQCLRHIIVPRILGSVFPMYTNELIAQLQATSLVSMITILDITGRARLFASQTFLFYQAFLGAAALYVVLVGIIVFVCRRVEQRFTRHMATHRSSSY